MAFAIRAKDSVPENVLRIARKQIDGALDGLTGRSGEPTEEVVHDARKRFKKIRALIRLVRPALGSRRAERENARFRDAGRPLSEVRDAGVLVDAFEALVKRTAGDGHDGARHEVVEAVRVGLRARQQAIAQHVLDEENALAVVIQSVQRARRRLKHWTIDEDGWSALAPGLKHVYRQGARAWRAASASRADEALHEWRKRVKDLWHVLELLKPIRPDVLDPQTARAHTLADRLGEDHDLAVLRALLTDPERDFARSEQLDFLITALDQRRDELQRDALTLGRAVYADRPRAFVDRLGAYWRAWRSEYEAARFEAHSRGKS